jgi:iron complex outermembrane recepter protein
MMNQSLIVTAAVAMALASAALSAPVSAAEPDANDGSGSVSGSAILQEVVVTAQRRAEDLQTVPLAITAMSASKLADSGVVDYAGLQNLVPGLEFGENDANGSMEIALRGVAPLPDFPGQDPVVAFNVDGVYNSRPAAANGLFYDIDRVEVLHGPQGTLYGRNSLAGAINVITNDPKNEFQAAAEVGTGNYGLLRSSGMLNIPLIAHKLAFRVAFQQEKHEGYINTGQPTENDDARDFAVRGKLLFTPTDNFSLLLSGDSYHETGEGAMEVSLCDLKTSNPWRVPAGYDTTQYPACAPTPDTPYYSYYGATLVPHDDTKNYGGSLKLNWILRPFTIVDILARRIVYFHNISKIAGEYGNTLENSGEVTNELRFVSNPGSKVTWVAGLFYFRELQSANTGQGDPLGYLFGYNWLFGAPADPTNPVAYPYGAGALENIVDTGTYTRSLAGYEQATYPLLDWLRITEGLRYTGEDKHAAGSLYFTQNEPSGRLLSPQDPFAATTDSHATNWKVGVDMDVTSESMVYFSASTGYKSGGWSEVPIDSGNPNTYQPETVTAFELGSKNRFLHRIQANVAVFLDNYQDYQTFEAVPLFDQYGYVYFGYPTINAATAKVYGLESENTFLLTQNDRIDLAVNYLHAKYGTAIVQGVDVSGTSLSDSPTWTINLGYQHVWRLGDERTLTASVQTHYRGWANMQQEPDDYLNYQSAYTNTSMVLAYNAGQPDWYVNAYVRNLENKAVISLATSQDNGSIAPPRTFGVNVGIRFH